ncbi:MAG: carboxypeptidase-like regulatory domain-containing protein [Armatimonadota bacterium]
MRRSSYAASAIKSPLVVLAIVALILCAGVSYAQLIGTPVWSDYHYYVNVDVNTGNCARTATPVELKINFTNYLNGTTFDPNSVRVAEFATKNDRTSSLNPVEIWSQFDQESGFDPAANAVGEVVWILRGDYGHTNTTLDASINPSNKTRYYRVYFDNTNNTKDATTYPTDLSYNVDPTNTSLVDITNHFYTAGIWAAKDSIYKLLNAQNGANLWTSTTDSSTGCGMYWSNTMFNAASGEAAAQQWANAVSLATSASANKAIRVTYKSTKTVNVNSSPCTFDTVRKFYSGVPYFKEDTTFTAPSNYNLWHNLQLRWNDNGSNKRTRVIETTEPSPIDPSVNMPAGMIYDYATDITNGIGGIGQLFAGYSMPQTIGTYSSTDLLYSAYYNYTYGGCWRNIGPYTPLYLSHATMVNSGADDASAKAEVETALVDYSTPVEVMITGSSTNSTSYGAIKGKVTDASNANRTVNGAMVRLWVNNTYLGKTYTSARGEYAFSNVPAGTAKLSVKTDGYETLVVSNVAITAGTVTTDNISLPSIIFDTTKSTNLWAASTTHKWQLVLDADVKQINADPSTTTQAEINAFAGPTTEAATTDVSVPNAASAMGFFPYGWDDLQTTDKVYGWYRTTVNIPSSWTAAKTLRLRDFVVSDSCEVYFNGNLVGKAGAFGSADITGTPLSFVIPASYVNTGSGATNVLAIKVYDNTSTGGIYAGGPTLEVAPDVASVTVNVKGPQTLGGSALPIQGAAVTLAGIGSGTTDVDGNCTFASVPGDTYTVTVNHPDYGTTTATADVPESGSTTVPVTYDSFLCTVKGTVTRYGTPLAYARVVVTDSDGNTNTAAADATGAYSIKGNKVGSSTITVNALNAVPVTNQPIQLQAMTVTLDNIDLAYATLPVYDDFSGTDLDTSKWQLYNVGTPTDGSIPVDSTYSLADGILTLTPAPGRGGLLSKTSMIPANGVGAYEVAFNQKATGTNQGFALLDPTLDDPTNIKYVSYGHGVCLEQQNWFVKAFLNSATSPNGNWEVAVDTTSGGLGYPARITILRTANYYDAYYNGKWALTSQLGSKPYGDTGFVGKMPVDTNTGKPYLSDNTYIYLNGYVSTTNGLGYTKGYFDEVRAGDAVPMPASTISDVRNSDASSNKLYIKGGIVTASFDDCYFIENSDRSAGIKVISTSKPAVGKRVEVIGNVVKDNREVAINQQDLTVSTDATVPPTVAITGKVAGELDKAGAAAQGLYVKVAGRVTGVTYDTTDTTKVNGYFLDDGSGLAGDNTNKGLYVKVDPVWGVSGAINGTFKTAEGVLTVTTAGGNIIPCVRTTKSDVAEPATYTAYNDCGFRIGFSSSPDDTNVTLYHIGTPSPTGAPASPKYATSGYLFDYDTGNQLPILATFTCTSVSATTWNDGSNACGADAAAGTDAYNVFYGKVNLLGFVAVAYPNTVTITFSGLNPNGLYEFATTGNRGGAATDANRPTKYTISGALAYTNTGSITGTGVTYGNDWITFDTRKNVTQGYIARWTNIQPSANGTFSITTQSTTNTTVYPLNAFMLKKLQ